MMTNSNCDDINSFEYTVYPNVGEMATDAINAAIMKAAEKGGGTVLIPPGRYVCGTIKLRSRVSIRLAPGAEIVGSENFSDYSPCLLRRKEVAGEKNINGALFYGEKVEDVRIYGEGKIDGRGETFWIPREGLYQAKNSRPCAVIMLLNSKRVSLYDLELANAPCYTVWLMGCESVSISRIRIDNPVFGPNTDGLDIDCCQNVTISDCQISAGDDCIALKSDTYQLGRNASCSNITVTNCVLSSPTCGVRIGYEGDGEIKNCCFSNLVMYDTRHGIDILSVVTKKFLYSEINKGATIRNISFSNITMERSQKAFYIWQGYDGDCDDLILEGGIFNLSFSNIIAEVSNGSYIGGVPDNPIRKLLFHNVRIRLTNDAPEPSPRAPTVFAGGALFDHVFTLRDTVNVEFYLLDIDTDGHVGWKMPSV